MSFARVDFAGLGAGRVSGLVLLALLVALDTGGEEGWWSGRFSLSGVRGDVAAILPTDTRLFVGGRFSGAGGVRVANLAEWDGTEWSDLGGDTDGEVRALVESDGVLYAGGTFSRLGGAEASLVARFDGERWSALGAGLQGHRVNSLVTDAAGMLYAAGEFTNALGVAVANIARWDGRAWSAMGSGLSNDPYEAWVWALAVRGNDLFAGGFFTDAGGVPADCVARWDGKAWHALGSGVDDRDYLPQVTALAVRGQDLFVGGAFTLAGNHTVTHVARWDGADWFPVGMELPRFFGEIPVRCLLARESDLVVGGRFDLAGGGGNLATGNGSGWSATGEVVGEVVALGGGDSGIVVGGDFVAGGALNNLAAADDGPWFFPGGQLCGGITGDSVDAVILRDDAILVGGDISAAGLSLLGNVGMWDGVAWTALGGGVNGRVRALCQVGSDVYAGGSFTTAGGTPASNVARWDGVNWAPLGNGVGGGSGDAVYSLVWHDGQLYAGGDFDQAGGQAAAHVARWDGTAWHPLGAGCDGTVHALAAGDRLYAGGAFRTAGGAVATNLACWDGLVWSEVGGGVGGLANPRARIRPPPVSALVWTGSELIVGGDFAWAGTVRATNIARWDGAAWHALGEGIPPEGGFVQPTTVAALSIWTGRVVAGGTFRTAGGVAANHLAVWDGQRWAGADGEATGAIRAVAASGGRMVVGGVFGRTGDRGAEKLGLWQPRPHLSIGGGAGSLRISWPALTSEGAIETRDAVAGGEWRETASVMELTDGEAVATASDGSARRFFRWRDR